MRVTITRSGGFAGIEEVRVIDTDALPEPDAERVARAVEELASRGPGAGEVGADLFEYRVEVTGAAQDQSFQVTDVGEPEGPSDPALARLVELSRPAS